MLKQIRRYIFRNIKYSTYVFLVLMLFVALPVILVFFYLQSDLMASVIFMLNLLIFFVSQVILVGLINHLQKPNIYKRFLIGIFAGIYVIIYVIIVADIASGGEFSLVNIPFIGLQSLFMTVAKVYGPLLPILIIFGLFLITYIIYISLKKELWKIKIKNKKKVEHSLIYLAIILLILVFLQSIANIGIANVARKTVERFQVEKYLTSTWDNSSYKTDSKLNVIILQLESVNFRAVRGNFSIDNNYYNHTFTPIFWNLSKKGVFFPEMYGNTPRTVRAQANILCQVFFNPNQAYAFKPQELRPDCLPAQLESSGYTSYFFRADTLEYTNFREFAPKMGFSKVHSEDIMPENITRMQWGYDDEDFYHATFNYLKNKTRPFFAYIEVSSHHAPFTSYKDDKNFQPPIKNATVYYQDYLNSIYWQDSHLKYFMDQFKPYENNTILIITGDHSWPIYENLNMMNQLNIYDDNFLTSTLYILPGNGFYKNKVVYNRHSHTDLIPTLFSILNNKSYQNSYIYDLKPGFDSNNYENCQVIFQPYGELKIVIVKNKQKLAYSLETQGLIKYDLNLDPDEKNPIVIGEKVSYEEFLYKNLCNRFGNYIIESKNETTSFNTLLQFIVLFIITFFIIDGITLTSRYFTLKKRSLHNPCARNKKEMKKYISDFRNLGYHDAYIKESLHMVGWSKEDIEKQMK